VFDRFPRLRTVVLESGAGWIGYWLDRADAIYWRTALGGTVQLKERPSFYFKRQCFISDERSIASLTKLIGEDRFFWASDYPHPDHPGDYLEELRGMVEGMSSTARAARTSRRERRTRLQLDLAHQIKAAGESFSRRPCSQIRFPRAGSRQSATSVALAIWSWS
jgi:Amidohydrolase